MRHFAAHERDYRTTMNENATPSEQIGVELASLGKKSGLLGAGQFASLKRRLVSMFYESLLLAALLLVAGFAYIPVFGALHGPFQKAVFQLYLLGVVGVYFVVFWTRGGQTLAMKTWRIRLVTAEGGAVSMPLCVRRYALAFAGLLCVGLGFLWAVFDREHQFLHDRLSGTRLVKTDLDVV